jgi:hypothetical protein
MVDFRTGGSAQCLRDFALPDQGRDRSLPEENAAWLLGRSNAQFVAGQFKVAHLLAAFVKLVPGSIDLGDEFVPVQPELASDSLVGGRLPALDMKTTTRCSGEKIIRPMGLGPNISFGSPSSPTILS